MIDPVTITGAAAGIATTVLHVIKDIEQFSRQVRGAREDMEGINLELGSLKTGLDLLSNTAESPDVMVPPTVGGIMTTCRAVLGKLSESIQKYNSDRLNTRIGYVWSGRDVIDGYRNSLKAHTAALGLAVNIMTLTLTRQVTTNTDAILDNTDDIISGIARLREAISRREDGTREGSNYVLEAYLEELTSYAGSVLGEGDTEVDINSEVPPANLLNIAAGSIAEVVVEDRLEVADVPFRVRGMRNEASGEDPPSYFMVQNADRPQIRPIRSFPERWEHYPEFDNIGLGNEADTRRILKFRKEIDQVPDWKVQPSRSGQGYKQHLDYRVNEEGYIDPGRTLRGHLSSFWDRKPRLRTNAEKIKWFYKFTTSGGDVNSILTLSYPDASDHATNHNFNAITAALLTRNKEWLDYLVAKGAEFGLTHYRMDTFDNSGADKYIRPTQIGGINALQVALNWNFATFRMLEDHYAILHQSDFLTFMRTDYGPLISDTFLIYVAGYFMSVLARSQTKRQFKEILSDALQLAIAQNKISMVRLLLAYGAKINDLRYIPFQIALGQSYWEIVGLLLDAGESLNRRLFYAPHYHAMSAWEYAALLGNLDELNRVVGTAHQVAIPPMPQPACVIL